MSYIPLKNYFYENRNEFEEEYNSRFNFFLLLTGITISNAITHDKKLMESYSKKFQIREIKRI